MSDTTLDLKKASITINSLVDAIPNDLVVVDNNNTITFLNMKAKTNLFEGIANFGEDFTQVTEKFINVHHIDPNDGLAELFRKGSTAGSFISGKLKISIVMSVKKTFELSTSPIYDTKLGHLGRIWQFNDITITENIDSIKTEFISLASHQLRTPLTSIRGYVNMVLGGDFGDINPGLVEPLQYVEQAGKEMSDLIEDLLSISRLEKKSSNSSFTEFDIDSLFKELEKLFIGKIQEKTINYQYIPYTPQLKVFTDQNLLRECLKNLIDNALKYSQSQGKVDIVTSKTENDWLRIEIIDNGLGIPDDQQDRIFEKFFRAANVLTENFNGTGLGLYYVKQVVETLGGKVYFNSKTNQGTHFFIEIPVKKPNE